MELWAIQWDCGDYYCDREHLAGVFPSEDDAKAALPNVAQINRFDRLSEAKIINFRLGEILEREF